MSVLKKYIMENFILKEETIQLQSGEKVLFQSPAKELSMSGKFRFQQNESFQNGRLMVTNKRVIFNGIAKTQMRIQNRSDGAGGRHAMTLVNGTGAQSYSFPVSGAFAAPQKLSIPEHIASLGLQAPFMKLFGTGYVRISGNGGDRGFSVNNPAGLITVINGLNRNTNAK